MRPAIVELLLLAALAAGGTTASAAIKEPVVVTAEAGRLKSESTLVGTVPAGTILAPEVKNGDWIWVTHTADGKTVKGWISSKDVASLDDAIALYSEAIRKKPTASTYFIRGKIWAAKEEAQKAANDFTEAITRDNKQAEIWYHRAMARLNKNEGHRVITDCSEAILLDNKYSAAYRLRGLALAKTGKLNEAIQDFGKALEIDPGDVPARSMRAVAYAGQNEFSKALEDYSIVVKERPENVEIRKSRAEVLTKLNRYDQALADLTEATRLAPQDNGAQDRLGWLLATCPDDAIRDGSRAVSAAKAACELTDWKNSYRLATLAAAHAEAGNFDEAVKWQKRAIELDRHGLADRFRERLTLYQSGKAYRQS